MRVTRLLAVALCAALVCASLGSAADTADTDNLQAGSLQGVSIGVKLSEEVNQLNGTCRFKGGTVNDFYGNPITCTDGDLITNTYAIRYYFDSSISTIKNVLQVQHAPLTFTTADLQKECSTFDLGVPDSYDLDGVDFFVFVTLRPMGADGHSLLSKVCTYDATTGRPTSGVVNIAAQYPSDTASGQRGLTGELLRLLGFDTTVFAAKGMLSRATVRGVDNVPLMSSSKVLQTARDFYGCSSMPGMELDYDSTNSNAPLPYWRGRVAKDDVMSTAGNMYYITPMTIAAMEDTGFYKGNYTSADIMPWGYKAGCDFVNQQCIQGGTSNFGNLFCTDGLSSSPTWHCTSDRRAIGRCGMTQASEKLPTPFRYFTNATEGGSLSTMDYCPVIQADITTSCVESKSALTQFTTGLSSRCFDTEGTDATYESSVLSAACFPVSCNLGSPTYSITLSSSTTASTPCPAGTTLDLSTIKGSYITIGTLTCPPYDEVCVQPFPQATDASSQPLSSSSAALSSSSQYQSIASSSASASSSSNDPTTEPHPTDTASFVLDIKLTVALMSAMMLWL